ncbi:LysR family transcriptional regulator [Burkholderia gladioli]|uniref:LysR family transcriptional regulator n=1 Tax=Burkholderia gladioli TaxID=28095 RepID=UPI003EDF93DD
MLTLRMLRTLQAVARSGSFATAAEKTALTQAAVSLQMRGLRRRWASRSSTAARARSRSRAKAGRSAPRWSTSSP